MIQGTHLTDLQVEAARQFFRLKESDGYVVAGGAGLLASGLIDRSTQDLDLFGSAPVASVSTAKESFLQAIGSRGWGASVVHDSATFCRLIVLDGSAEVLVDLAIDSPSIGPPTTTVLGPTLAPLELAGRKLLALFGRAEARDFSDVYVLARRFGKEALLEQAAAVDRGFDTLVLAQMMATLRRFDDAEIPAPTEGIEALRAFFATWASAMGRPA